MKHFAETSVSAAPMTTNGLAQPIPLWRWVLFAAASILALAAYAMWRPPLPMLWLQNSVHLGRDSNEIAMTFDDSPHPLTTPLLLASLQHAEVKATFFSVGENLKLYPELAHRIVSEGHDLGNHSQPHHNLTTVNPRDYTRHIDAGFATINAVEKSAGVAPSNTTLFRPPGGGLNRAAMDYLYHRGYTLAWWSNNVGDWTCPPAWKIADSVKAGMRPGDILLLHDGGTGTPQALDSIVKDAHKRGLKFVLLNEKPDKK